MLKKKVLLPIIIIAVLSIAIGLYSKKHDSVQYKNPIFSPVLADPSIIKGKDQYYYAYGTEDDWGDGHGPHVVPIIRSNDLIHWKFYKDAFTIKPDWKDGGGGIWAPDISYHNGKYYLYYALSIWGDTNPAIGVATSERPGGPFTDHGALFTSDSIGVGNSIDPQYFKDTDGKSYLFWGSFQGIYGIQLSDDGFKTEGDKFQVADTNYEAPYVIKRGKYYYFFGSSGSCCDGANSTYHVLSGRALSVKGPFKDQKGQSLLESGGTPILTANEKPNRQGKKFVGPGHNAIITDKSGADWMVYHAIDADDPNLLNGATKRPLMIDRIFWKNGWPTVKKMEPSTGLTEAPITN